MLDLSHAEQKSVTKFGACLINLFILIITTAVIFYNIAIFYQIYSKCKVAQLMSTGVSKQKESSFLFNFPFCSWSTRRVSKSLVFSICLPIFLLLRLLKASYSFAVTTSFCNSKHFEHNGSPLIPT